MRNYNKISVSIIMLVLLLALPSFSSLVQKGSAYIPQNSLGGLRKFLHVEGQYLYTADYLERKVTIYDLSIPTSPTLITQFAVPTTRDIHDMWYQNNTLFIAHRYGGFTAIKLSSAKTMISSQLHGTISYSHRGITGNGSNVYISDYNGKKIVTYIITAAGITQQQSIAINYPAYDLAMSNSGRYLFASIAGQGIQIYDTYSSTPALLATIANSYTIEDIVVSNDDKTLYFTEIYSASGNQPYRGFTSVDISNISSPVRMYSKNIQNMRNIAVNSESNKLYTNIVGYRSYSIYPKIISYDISNPVAATADQTISLGSYIYRSSDQLGEIQFENGYLYLINGEYIRVYEDVDSEGPQVAINFASLRNGTVMGALTITGDDRQTGGSNIKSLLYNIDNGSWRGHSVSSASQTSQYTWSLSEQYTPGAHSICVKAVDSNNNYGDARCITLNQSNHAPTAVITTQPTIYADATCRGRITLDGRASSDPENRLTTYRWASPVNSSANYVSLYGTLGLNNFGLTVTDSYNTSNTVQASVNVLDNTLPSFITIPTLAETEATSANGAVISVGAPTVSDNCTSGIIATRTPTGNQFPLGTTQIIFRASDASGNIKTASTSVTVIDTKAPVIPAIGNIVFEATGAQTPVTVLAINATDIVDGTVATTNNSSAFYAVGTHTVTYTATDGAGNTASKEINVTIIDNTAPTITGTSDVSSNASAAQTAVVLPPVAATDLVDGAIVVTNNAPATFPVGATLVTYSATDAAGNTATATLTVTVTDVTAPVISGNADVSVNADLDQTLVSLPTVNALDNVDGAIVVTNNAPATFPVGATLVTYSATDAAGNTATATLTVTVTDVTAPVISGNTDVSVNADLDQTLVSLPTVNALDNVDGAIVVTNNAPATFPVGATLVTYSATDAAGNTATATLTVTVTDVTAPVISGNADVSVNADLDQTLVSLPTVNALDNVDGAIVVTNNAPATFPVGATLVTYSAIDAAGNTATATLTVTVTDVTAPVIQVLEDITLEATGPETSVEMLIITAQDNVDGFIATSNNAQSVFTLGSHIVTFTAIDVAGNSSTATMTVTITDLTAPVIPAVENISIEATTAETEIAVKEVVALDLVDGDVTVSHNAPAVFPVGETMVTYSTSDAQSNLASLSIIVTVTDNTAPVIKPLANIVVEATAAGTPVTLATGIALDLVDGPLTPTNDAPTVFPVGITTVTYSSVDAAGNTGSETMTVTVTDNTIPDLSVPTDITVKPEGFMTSVVIPTGTAFDLVDRKLVPSNDAPSEFPLGTTVVTYTVTDAHNNTTTKTINVNIEFSGLYEIRNTNSDRCVEVAEGYKHNGANVQQYYCNNTFAQRWELTHLGSGIYGVKNLNAQKHLDVQDMGNNENVHIWGNTVEQASMKWKITLNASGIAQFNPLSDLSECLDIQGANVQDKINVLSYSCNGSAAQDFILTDASHKPTHLSGVFEIRNDVSNKCIDVSAASTDYGANVQQWDCNFSGAQMWEFKHIEDEWYELINFNSGLLLDVSWGGSNENVQQWGDVNSSSQRWRIVESGNGTYNLQPKSDGHECLDVQGQAEWAGANIISTGCNGTGAQRFQLIDLDY